MQERTFRLRVTYRKSGRLAMLSHLEITHALERIVRRSKLPFALSQGFSPHMKLAFGSALPVGVGSSCEIFDIVLEDYVAPKKALSALSKNSPDDLMCISCEYVEPSAKAASIAYPFSVYEIVFDRGVDGFDVPGEIEVVRKKKTKTLVTDDFLVGDIFIEGNKVRFQTVSGNNGNLRPDVLISSSEIAPDIASVLSVTRIAQNETASKDIGAIPSGTVQDGSDGIDPIL